MSENKTGKYLKYAIGEIILVMIGILLALQVSEWNTNSKRQQQETQILKDLHTEFTENKVQLDTVVKYHATVRNGAKNIIELFPIDTKTVNIDSLNGYMRQMRFKYTFNPQQTTINTLTSTSSFDLISNTELRKVLQRWSELFNDYRDEELALVRLTENDYHPFLSKHTSMSLAGLKNPKVNLEFVTSLEFENYVRRMFYAMQNILGLRNEISEIDNVYSSINRIIELTETSAND